MEKSPWLLNIHSAHHKAATCRKSCLIIIGAKLIIIGARLAKRKSLLNLWLAFLHYTRGKLVVYVCIWWFLTSPPNFSTIKNHHQPITAFLINKIYWNSCCDWLIGDFLFGIFNKLQLVSLQSICQHKIHRPCWHPQDWLLCHMSR